MTEWMKMVIKGILLAEWDNEMKWNEVKWNEVEWSEMRCHETMNTMREVFIFFWKT